MAEYEQRHGKVDLSRSQSIVSARDVHGRLLPPHRNSSTGAGASLNQGAVVVARDGLNSKRVSAAAATSTTAVVATSGASSPLRQYAEWYLNSATVTTVSTVEHFKHASRKGGRKQEEYLWGLMQDIFTDAEHADQYNPDAIGIEATQPHRRWFISQYAHLQAFLQRHPVLRRATLICRWLETTYRAESRQEPRLHGEDDVVLRQLILTYLRGGELHRAIQAAVTYGSCVHSCVLSAAQLQVVQEPWFTQTALVPLFGEYAHGELDQSWAGNDYRLDNLSQLYEESAKYRAASPTQAGANTSESFDAVIAAALCGNLSVLETAFKINGGWKDMVWCYLRCALVVAFTKQLTVAAGGGAGEDGRPAGGGVDSGYTGFLEEMTGSEDDWATTFSRKLVHGLSTRLLDGFLPQSPVEEQLQMRFILQTLTSMGGAALPPLLAGPPTSLAIPLPPTSVVAAAVADSMTSSTEWFDVAPEEGNPDAVRLITHAILALDVAYAETLSPHSVQVCAGPALAASLARYAVLLAVLPRCPFDEGLRDVTAMTLRLRDPRHRADVYTAFIRAARDYELQRNDLSRSQLEEQESRLVHQFVAADADPAVHSEVQRLLYQQLTPAEMLTHNKLAEKLLWEAMHASCSVDYVEVLRRGLQACCDFWLSTPQPEVEAIADVSSILSRRVLVELQKATNNESTTADTGAASSLAGAETSAEKSRSLARRPSRQPVTDLERSEATFWDAWSEARQCAARHATTVAQLSGARSSAAFDGPSAASPSRTLIYQLTQEEAAVLHRLVEQTQQGIRHGGAVVHRDAQCLTAIMALLRQLTEAVTLSILASTAALGGVPTSTSAEQGGGGAVVVEDMEDPGTKDELQRMQLVYGLLEELHQAGYLEPELLPQACAADLYTQIRTMRVSYGQCLHKRQVLAALRRRASASASGAAADATF